MSIDSTRIRALATLALVATAPVPAHAADSGERARIASERAEVEQRYAERERACGERFVVTSCVDDAKRERRETVRGNSWTRGPSVYNASGSTAADRISLTRRS